MKTTLGGNRLGSGNKQEISMRNYERSTHDLSELWRSTMSAGTLVPFLNKLALPGDKWEIDLNCEVLTVPTVGPLFGSYKVQLDIFEVPLRLYNAKLHQNKLGVGMNMSQIYLPLVDLFVANQAGKVWSYDDNEQVNSSALLKYLGITGAGRITGATNPAKRPFNATSFLAYWDIFKNYYSNKQEANAYVIHTGNTEITGAMAMQRAILFNTYGAVKGDILSPNAAIAMAAGDYLVIYFLNNAQEPDWTSIAVQLAGAGNSVSNVFTNHVWNPSNKTLTCTVMTALAGTKTLQVTAGSPNPINQKNSYFGLKPFALANIDAMKDLILQYAGAGAFRITNTNANPYNLHMETWGNYVSATFSQEGLAVKTYQSDLFNNWIQTGWITGSGSIAELTAVSTAGNTFTIDALNIAQKVYDMLNRIAISGGTYDNWLEAVYTHERVRGIESPVYCGGLIKELAFEEVISLANTSVNGDTQPLGTLAGRGRLTHKHKGGRVEITVNEPSIIMGIVSLTPRIEYSQGNDWIVNLKTYDDFHKPALDAIGYQDLITEQLLHSDGAFNSATEAVTYRSLGKQPAWINYMTSVNKCYGGFAEPNNSMFMVLNRRYEKNTDGTLKDGTTYIDPTKYNQIFAETALDSQNFWVQISKNITVRRKMSAKIIPNL